MKKHGSSENIVSSASDAMEVLVGFSFMSLHLGVYVLDEQDVLTKGLRRFLHLNGGRDTEGKGHGRT